MHVVERGSGDPVVLIHGFGVDHRLMLALDPLFEAAGGWRRIYLDLPGHGETAADHVSSSEDVVSAVEDELRDRVGEERFAIVGNSFGGMIARRVAHDCRNQVLGLALIAPLIIAKEDQRNTPKKVALYADAAVIDRLGPAGEHYEEMAVVQTRESSDAFMVHAYPGLTKADQDALSRLAENYALEAEPEETSPEPFTQPTLFLTARQDQVVGYKDAWAQMNHYPRATFATLDAAGHNVHLDRPGIVHALMTDWLARMRMQ